MKRWAAIFAVTSIAASLLAVPGAQAATEVGGNCVADASEEDWTVAGLTRTGNPFPMAVPAAGVVTRWKMQVEASESPLAQRLLVFRATGKANELLTVDESETRLVFPGANEFATRIPVRAGDRFGLYGLPETYFCSNEDTDTSGLFDGEAPLGDTRLFKVREALGTPVSVLVEPDADRDGYGDETQDRCPKSAAYHRNACSAVKLTIRAVARRRSIRLGVKASADVSVQVFGQVGWGFKSKRKSSGGRSKPTRLIVGLRGGRKNIAVGEVASFSMALPKAVLRRLSRIGPRESLKAVITVRATDSEGALAERRIRVELKGQDGSERGQGDGEFVLTLRWVRSPAAGTLRE